MIFSRRRFRHPKDISIIYSNNLAARSAPDPGGGFCRTGWPGRRKGKDRDRHGAADRDVKVRPVPSGLKFFKQSETGQF